MAFTVALDSVAHDVLDRLHEGCQILSFDWRYLYVNEALLRQSAQSREALVGRTMMDCYPGIEATAMFAELRRCMAERCHHRMENEFTFPDGSKGWFELSIVPIPAGLCVLSSDTTVTKRAQEALRQSEAMLRDLHEALPDAVLLVDREGTILTANKAAEGMFGYERLVGRRIEELVPEDVRDSHVDKRAAFARSPRARRLGEGGGLRALRADGSEIPVEISVGLTTVRDEPAVVAVVRDVTDRNQLEERLLQSQKLQALGSLAGGIAHDFNNLLSIILSYSEMLVGDVKPQDPIRADLETIHAAGVRASELTRQLLAFGRKQVLEPRPASLNAVVSSFESMLFRVVGEDVELRFLPDPRLGAATVDPRQIEQIVMNLVVNARDAMPKGGKLTIETQNVELTAEYAALHVGVQPGHYVLLAVSDNGVGMDAATRARVFEPFFTTKERGRGTGLGLATVFGIVKQSGGHIWVYSEPGAGSTFKVYFPRSEAPPVELPSDAAPPPTPRRRGRETVLLVEDDADVRALASTILRRHGYHVLEALTGGDALLIGEQHGATIHLMVTDVVMPRMSGRELAHRLERMRPDMKVLYMSGYTDNSIVHHGVLDSGVAFLQKPITPEALTRKVREVLDG